MIWRIPTIVLVIILSILDSGCVASDLYEQKREKTGRMPNPASQKCVDDGFHLEQIYKNGVPVGAMCINQATGIKCEEWSYFRGECILK